MGDRIVPVHRTDLINLYYTMLSAAGSAPEVLHADNPGEFTISAAGLCEEPVKTAKITAESGTVYFVPAFDYAGCTDGDGNPITVEGDVEPDGRSLYSLNISSGTYTATKVSM